MGCRFAGSVVRLAAPARPVAGEAELILVKYLGWVDEITLESVTGAQYIFGLEKQKGYVDSRDLDAILAVQEDTKKMFELAE